MIYRPYHHRRSTEAQKAFRNRGLNGHFLVKRLASASRTTAAVGWFLALGRRGDSAAHSAGAGVFLNGKEALAVHEDRESSSIAGPAIETDGYRHQLG